MDETISSALHKKLVSVRGEVERGADCVMLLPAVGPPIIVEAAVQGLAHRGVFVATSGTNDRSITLLYCLNSRRTRNYSVSKCASVLCTVFGSFLDLFCEFVRTDEGSEGHRANNAKTVNWISYLSCKQPKLEETFANQSEIVSSLAECDLDATLKMFENELECLKKTLKTLHLGCTSGMPLFVWHVEMGDMRPSQDFMFALIAICQAYFRDFPIVCVVSGIINHVDAIGLMSVNLIKKIMPPFVVSTPVRIRVFPKASSPPDSTAVSTLQDIRDCVRHDHHGDALVSIDLRNSRTCRMLQTGEFNAIQDANFFYQLTLTLSQDDEVVIKSLIDLAKQVLYSSPPSRDSDTVKFARTCKGLSHQNAEDLMASIWSTSCGTVHFRESTDSVPKISRMHEVDVDLKTWVGKSKRGTGPIVARAALELLVDKIVPVTELIKYMIASRFRSEKGDQGELFGQVFITAAQMKLLKAKPRPAFHSYTVEEFLRALLGTKLKNLSKDSNKTFKELFKEFANAQVRFFHFVRVEESVTVERVAQAFIAGHGIHAKHNQVG